MARTAFIVRVWPDGGAKFFDSKPIGEAEANRVARDARNIGHRATVLRCAPPQARGKATKGEQLPLLEAKWFSKGNGIH